MPQVGEPLYLRGAAEWKWTLQALDALLREAATASGIPEGSWVLIDREEKEVAIELMRSGKGGLDAMIVRGGAGLRKTVAEQTKVPILCDDGGLSHVYVDEDTDLPMAQNLVINSKIQLVGASKRTRYIAGAAGHRTAILTPIDQPITG
ncbi:MAG: hypothetical protein HC938_01240, partial [Nitrospira sp.]|nr:hypothetical protein [Nitrospira sp.]